MNFIRYTFKPGFSAFLVLVSLFTVLLLAVFYSNPLHFYSLVSLYLSFMVFCLLGNWLRFLHYKKTAPQVQIWNSKRKRMETHIYFDPY